MSGKDGGWILPEELDPERFCFIIEIPKDRFHIYAFFGALQELTYWFNWQRDDEQTGKQVGDIWREIIDQARLNMDLERECDDVFDPCCPDEIEEQRAARRQQSRLYNHSLELLDDGTSVTSYAPNAPADFSAGTAMATNLCTLIENFIFECMVGRIQSVSDVVVPIMDLPNHNPLFGAVILEGLGNIVLGHMNELISDQSARSKVACCMFDALKDQPVEFSYWEDSLNACDFEFPDPEAEIAGIVGANLTIENFRAFVRELSVQVPGGEAGNNCACDCTVPPSMFVGTMVDNGGGSYTLTSEDWTYGHSVLYGQPERIGWPTIRYTLPGCCTIISGTVDDAGTGGSLIGYYVDCDDGVYEAPGVFYPPLDTSYKFYLGYRAHEDSTQFEITIILDGG